MTDANLRPKDASLPSDISQEAPPSSGYHKTPLIPRKPSTRLLTLERDPDGSITGSLHTCDLDSPTVDWIVLSYTWAADERDPNCDRLYNISINGCTIQIGLNLWRALQALLNMDHKAPESVERAATSDKRSTSQSQHWHWDCKRSVSAS